MSLECPSIVRVEGLLTSGFLEEQWLERGEEEEGDSEDEGQGVEGLQRGRPVGSNQL